MKKKYAGLLIAAVLSALLMMSGCGKVVHFAASAEGTLYTKGEQTLTLRIPSDYSDVKFETSIAASDISLPNELKGKTVTAVTYVEADTVTVTISGSLAADAAASDGYPMINVADHALTGTSTAEYMVTLASTAPHMSAASCTRRISDGAIVASSTYVLSYGSFVPAACTTEAIRTDNGTGTVEVTSCDENSLTVKVTGYEDTENLGYARITIARECTTFNHEVTILAGKPGATADLFD